MNSRSLHLLALIGLSLCSLFSPRLDAELTAVQREQAQMSALALAAGQVAKADVLRPTDATPADAADWLAQRGRWLLRDEKTVEAERDFLAAKKFSPSSVPAAAGLAEVAWQLGHKDEAKALILAVAELRKEEDPNAQFYGVEPGVPHIFLLQQEMNYGGVTENTVNVFPLGEALPDALLMAARNAAKEGDLATVRDLSTRAIAEAGGKFPAAERLRQTVFSGLAQANAMEPSSPELGRLRFFAETQLAKGEAYNALRAAAEALKSGRDLPTFGARQLLFARAVAAAVLKAEPGPQKISEVDANTREATHIFASAPEPDAASIAAQTALLERLRKIDPLWPAGTLPAPAKLATDSPLRLALTAESLRAGSDRVVALEKTFLAAWGGGPTAVDLETAEGRVRWGEIGREGALIAHLRWLTSPADSKEALEAWTDARQRTILALLCRPEDTAAFRALQQHEWAKYFDERGSLVGKNDRFVTAFAKLLTSDPKKGRNSPPENPEELSYLVSSILPLATGSLDLPRTQPGIAAAVSSYASQVIGRVRFKDLYDLTLAGETLMAFTWESTADPARTLDVRDWVNAQLESTAAPGLLPVSIVLDNIPAVAATPLGHFVETLDAWLAAGAPEKRVPTPASEWAAVPAVAWRFEKAAWRHEGRIDLAALTTGAAPTPEWSLSRSHAAVAGRVMQELDRRFGANRLTEKMSSETAAAWLKELATYETVILANKASLSAEARERLTPRLHLHRAQVQLAAGDLAAARTTAPAITYALENDKNWNGHDPIVRREETGANLVVIQPKPRPAPEVYKQPEPPKPVVSAMKPCERCGGSGRIYFNTTRTTDVRSKETDGYGHHEVIGTETSRGTDSMMCSRCLGTGEVKR